jgi:hypothetical protein
VSGIGRTNTGRSTFEQRSTNVGFERLHLSRKRRLRYPESDSGSIEAPFLHNNQERPQLS